MGRDFAECSPAARAVFEKANRLLGWDLTVLCFQGPAERLEQTDIQQPAIFVTSAAIWEAWLAAGGSRDEFACAGGLSLGEYTALYAAGALSFEDALRLVHRRGQLMQQAASASPSGMVCLIGADSATAEAVCQEVRDAQVLVPANYNCPGQIVIAGDKAACERATSTAEKHGLRAVSLAVAGAFHTPLMQSAADELSGVLDEVEFHSPRIPVISNVDAEYHGTPPEISRKLALQVTRPVRWQACVERMVGAGVTRFVEFGPGRVLTGLLRKIDRKLQAVNIATAEALGQPASPT